MNNSENFRRLLVETLCGGHGAQDPDFLVLDDHFPHRQPRRDQASPDRAHEVTNLGYDRDALATMAHAAREEMSSDAIEAIADKGYDKGEEIVACEEAGIPVTVPKPHTSNAAAHGRFDRADFTYVGSDDAYVCPAGSD